ncbi:MAG: D-alanyl-D-alanine carboxypeptidase [Firmicutes bacterium]|nr:D-alanyl-D-alanine carboxypeptidase [Bacillota bacterium]
MKFKSKFSLAVFLTIFAFLCVFLPLGGLNKAKITANGAGGSAFIAMEVTSGRVLQGSNTQAKLPMASTTKAMTALVVLEKCDTNSIVTIPRKAVGIEGSSIYLKEGEKLTVNDLLYGLMLRSGNDTAVALAIFTAGSEENFVKLMNLKAQELGLKNTNFTNPHGLHNQNHYTTAYDLAVISCVAMQNPKFKEIVSAKSFTVQGEGKETRHLANKNKILFMYQGGTGIKTGFTKVAGRCLIASSERNGMEVVAVALNCPDMWNDCMGLMDYSHANYHMVKAIDKDFNYRILPVSGGKSDSVLLYAKNDKYYPLKKDGSEHFETSLSTASSLKAPVKKGAEAGKIQVTLGNRLLFEEKLYSIVSVDKKGFWDKFKDFFKD